MSINTTIKSGFLLVDKPAGPTSHDIVQRLKNLVLLPRGESLPRGRRRRLYGVGHTGTLDPFATGLLIVAFGTATRLIDYTHAWSKTYRVEIILGATSDTDDATGHITPAPAGKTPGVNEKTPGVKEAGSVKKATVNETLKQFTGPQQQIPPLYSAVKVKGKKLYEYARAGRLIGASAKIGDSIVLKPREITIHNISLLNFSYPNLNLEVTCGTGTYIRALARDIGRSLGTGAYVKQLRRTNIGKFALPAEASREGWDINKITPETLPSLLLPPAEMVSHLYSITVSDTNVAQLRQGQKVKVIEKLPDNQPIALFNNRQILVGIGRAKDNYLSPVKNL